MDNTYSPYVGSRAPWPNFWSSANPAPRCRRWRFGFQCTNAFGACGRPIRLRVDRWSGATTVIAFSIIACLHGVPAMAAGTDVVLEDFSDIVTANDRGFNDFSGNMGDINGHSAPGTPPNFGSGTVVCESATECAMRFAWNFGGQMDAFTGQFLSLFGLTSTLWSPNGQTFESISFPEHVLDLERVDGAVAEPGGPRRFLEICGEFRYGGVQPLNLKVEVQDAAGRSRFTRRALFPRRRDAGTFAIHRHMCPACLTSIRTRPKSSPW